MKQKKQNALSVLLEYAGSHRRLTLLGLGLSAVSMVCSMIPYLCIWLAARDLIAVAPDWTQARSVTDYGWIAFAFAVGGILIYFLGLMCTHLAAFRTAANIRKQGMAHVMQAPLGYFDANASGLIRSRLDERILADLEANNQFWDRYEGKVADAAEAVNDTYLKANRQEHGVASYGMVVDLMLGWYGQMDN